MCETRMAWNDKGSLRCSEAEITLLEARHLPVADECLLRAVAQRSFLMFTCVHIWEAPQGTG